MDATGTAFLHAQQSRDREGAISLGPICCCCSAPVAVLSCSSARVAQLDRASASGAEGCGFDPRLAHHLKNPPIPLIRFPKLFTGRRGEPPEAPRRSL